MRNSEHKKYGFGDVILFDSGLRMKIDEHTEFHDVFLMVRFRRRDAFLLLGFHIEDNMDFNCGRVDTSTFSEISPVSYYLFSTIELSHFFRNLLIHHIFCLGYNFI